MPVRLPKALLIAGPKDPDLVQSAKITGVEELNNAFSWFTLHLVIKFQGRS